MSGDNLTGTWRAILTTNIATVMVIMKTMMECLAEQDASNKATNEHLNASPVPSHHQPPMTPILRQQEDNFF
ncbi:hypothetical protein F2Q70_00021988 [Brassica cretica]|uniref:Uncharacterized protein n=2 Tax=Brassica cretica TaxID=69181 RepID=A0A8S9S7H9_BRACR|nr:hypothetical protein F2Q70_00021988 [Brassica cretica]KAF2558017.1 hypothetical protein F2Q68_00015769 [Brassica cretica]KAF3587864.1 hypothetical protein F2Q69_00029587 [Brassica cretica]KAF3606640.1 hypothetical protein DY000_02048344 [Brassica cretica]